jgi:uncharacterized damage-inducible protein DinB
MTEMERVLDQHHRSWDGDAWHGPSLREVLRDISASQASARPLAGAHTIAEIVQHLSYWRWAAIERVNGVLVSPEHDEQWPPMRDNSEAAWQEALALLESRHQALMHTLRNLSDEQLAQPIAGRNYNLYVQLHGNLQHDIYHIGQIALLKRAVRA